MPKGKVAKVTHCRFAIKNGVSPWIDKVCLPNYIAPTVVDKLATAANLQFCSTVTAA